MGGGKWGLLETKPIPSIREVWSAIREESRLMVMMTRKSSKGGFNTEIRNCTCQ